MPCCTGDGGDDGFDDDVVSMVVVVGWKKKLKAMEFEQGSWRATAKCAQTGVTNQVNLT
jgi:hypothetical protein